MIDDKRLEHMLLAGKQILYKSHQESDVRYVKNALLDSGIAQKDLAVRFYGGGTDSFSDKA